MNLTNLLDFVIKLLNINQQKPYLTLVTGDFNVRSSSWLSDSINTTEGTKLLSLTSRNGFQQIINEPTHLKRQSSLCIDLIFLDQPNLSAISGFQPIKISYIFTPHLPTPSCSIKIWSQYLLSSTLLMPCIGLQKSRCI